MLSDMSVETLTKRIQGVKRELMKLGDIRPGSLSMQYNVCGKPNCHCKDKKNPRRHGPYYQVSYTRKGKSRTEFVRSEDVPEVRRHIANYAKFRKLVDTWIELSIQIATLRRLKPRK